MTRVAHVTDAYLPRLGGIETHVDGLARAQSAAGDDVHVLTTTYGPPARRISGPEVHRATRAGLRQLLARGAFDVVHVHVSVFSPLGMSLTAAACSLGVPVAVTVHSMWPDHQALVRPAGAGLQLARRPVAWSTVSASAARPLRRVLGDGVPVSIVPNAVDVDWWRAGCERPDDTGARGGEVVVISLMRMAARKRPVPLLRAMRRARDLVDPAVRMRLVIGGDGPQQARVRRLVGRWGMSDWVDLPGRLTAEEARALLHASDVYVAPADLESFGIAALEARAVGLPVLAKRAGGVGEFVRDGTEGLLVGDDTELALAVGRLVSRPDLRREIRAHNGAVPPTTTWSRALADNAALYRRAAALAGSGRAAGRPRPDEAVVSR